MASARANNVYLGMPAVILALGEPGVTASSLFLAMTLPIYNLVSILWGEIVISGEVSRKSARIIVVKALENPLVISSLLGLLAAQLEIPVPQFLLTSFKLIGDAATGIALVVLGMGIKLSGLISAFRRTASDVAIKLILHPAVVWGLLIIWPVEDVFLRTAVIISSMPTAVNTLIIASGMGLDEQYACETVAVTTILATITIPVWISLLGI
jgi:predicted permease